MVKLHQLAHKRPLSGEEADELLRLYQSASAHLSFIRSIAPESGLSAALSAILVQSRTRFTGAGSKVMADLVRFFVAALPAALYLLRWLTESSLPWAGGMCSTATSCRMA